MPAPPRLPEIEDALKRFIEEDLLEDPLRGRDPLAEGEVDSLGIEQLVEYVFEAWSVELHDDEIVEENFESVPALAALVDSKR
jgi:acyl carrier protein